MLQNTKPQRSFTKYQNRSNKLHLKIKEKHKHRYKHFKINLNQNFTNKKCKLESRLEAVN